jgi:hypothetical protein
MGEFAMVVGSPASAPLRRASLVGWTTVSRVRLLALVGGLSATRTERCARSAVRNGPHCPSLLVQAQLVVYTPTHTIVT